MGCKGCPQRLCYGYAEGTTHRTNRFLEPMTTASAHGTLTTTMGSAHGTTRYEIPLQTRLDAALRAQAELLVELETAPEKDWDAIYRELGQMTALAHKMRQLMANETV